ncbi:nuclear transport factor 2 family protein [Tenacibaculum sp. M341]|uniref:nuclear transport factor 2 family protein n=1 Tax=Tenacibaculum sp. M341 TaxID=2530339 RepID=UPI001053F4ED|nr:nuclear transport factor 2 family protein [Tenacibaculum sp. M341]TCI91817.1 hypothetical protein EYW44_09700 [Tenacibaculum sp. M341]
MTKDIKKIGLTLLLLSSVTFNSCSDSDSSQETLELTNVQKAVALIEAFETGDTAPLDYVSNETYIQHNLNFPSGKEAIVPFFTGEASGITVKIHRVFSEGEFVFLHTTYGGAWNNGTPQVVFDIFKFENGLIVEHWDNLQDEILATDTVSGNSMTDGVVDVLDLDKTSENKILVTNFVNDILKEGKDNITDFISTEKYIQHNPQVGNGLDGLVTALQFFADNNLKLQYDTVHYVYAEGNFVLTVSEGGFLDSQHVAYYDLFRVENGKIVEHWDVIQNIPAQSEWKNDNGKF